MIKKDNQNIKTGQIAIYKAGSKNVELRVKIEKDTVWLTQLQMAELFGSERSVITKHLRNVFNSKELDKDSVCAKIAHTAADGKIYKTQLYNLDAVISVGYRVNSQRATQFRIWATRILKDYLLEGYAVNEKRLTEAREKFDELQNAITFLEKKSKINTLKGQEKEILSLLADYSKTLTLLEQYDKGKLKARRGRKSKFILEYKNSVSIIRRLKKELVSRKQASGIFGNETGHGLESIVKNLYQTFSGKQLYNSIEDKSAHLLYLIIKDHPFVDGNKRIASFLFVYFLDKNEYLYRNKGEKKINDNALTALSILIAESLPKEKDQMIALITQLLQ